MSKRKSLLLFAVIILIAIAFTITLILLGYPPQQPPQQNQSVMPQPLKFFLNASESKELVYRGNNISINYTITYFMDNPFHRVEVKVNGKDFAIEKDVIQDCEEGNCGVIWTVDDIEIRIEPVTWKTNPEGQKVWSFESWATTQIYVEINPIGGPPKPEGTKQL